MEKEIRLILNELRTIENTEGSDKITSKKIDEICKNHGVTFEELRDSVLKILTDETGISRDELESLSFEKISEKDLDTISGGVPSTKRNIASVMASLSCLTGVYAAPTKNIKSSQSSVSQTVDYVVAGSNKSQKTSKNVDANKLLKKFGIPATVITVLLGGWRYLIKKQTPDSGEGINSTPQASSSSSPSSLPLPSSSPSSSDGASSEHVRQTVKETPDFGDGIDSTPQASSSPLPLPSSLSSDGASSEHVRQTVKETPNLLEEGIDLTTQASSSSSSLPLPSSSPLSSPSSLYSYGASSSEHVRQTVKKTPNLLEEGIDLTTQASSSSLPLPSSSSSSSSSPLSSPSSLYSYGASSSEHVRQTVKKTPDLLGSASYYNHRPAAVYDRVTKGIYTDSALDIYNSIPGDKRSKTIIGVLPIQPRSQDFSTFYLPQLFMIPPTENQTTAYKYFLSSWEKSNGKFGRLFDELFLVYADGHIDINNRIVGQFIESNNPKASDEFYLKFRPGRNFIGGKLCVKVSKISNECNPTINWFYFYNNINKNYFYELGCSACCLGNCCLCINPNKFYSVKSDSLEVSVENLRNFFENKFVRNQHYDMDYEFNPMAEYVSGYFLARQNDF